MDSRRNDLLEPLTIPEGGNQYTLICAKKEKKRTTNVHQGNKIRPSGNGNLIHSELRSISKHRKKTGKRGHSTGTKSHSWQLVPLIWEEREKNTHLWGGLIIKGRRIPAAGNEEPRLGEEIAYDGQGQPLRTAFGSLKERGACYKRKGVSHTRKEGHRDPMRSEVQRRRVARRS